MEVLRDLRTLGRLSLVLGAVAMLSTSTATSAEAQRRRNEPAPPPGPQWPLKTREHVDLWLHGFALLQEDTAKVPFFQRGYAERLTVLKNSRGLYTEFDKARNDLMRIGAERNLLLNAQFLPLYFGSWDEMRQAFEYFFKAEGNPRSASNQQVAGIIAFLAQQFPRSDDRAWAKRFVETLHDEYAQFYKAYWLETFRARGAALAKTDSLWQGSWRPAMQRFLSYVQQPDGNLILSLPLGGEGRALGAGKSQNEFAVPFPATPDSAEIVLYVFAHEVSGSIARNAVNDHLTPAQQRAGEGERYSAAGLVRGGALLVERLFPGMGERYARYYLAQMGVAYEGSATAALEAAFPMLPEMVAEMKRQIELSFQGI
ncbi:MAG: hypothetical protein KF709_07940 [Gemmatimonadaceae bacterium]|nr:hypothetical protein [Gemmatimonadaceae bacterium]